MTTLHDLATPAALVDIDALTHNLTTMSAVLPGALLRPHVKAHKSTALAEVQRRHGHRNFTCATVREMVGMARAGLGDDLLLANECLDSGRLRQLAELKSAAPAPSLPSPVNMRPVRLAPCAAGASPTINKGAFASPNPGTGRAQYSSLANARFRTRPTRLQ